jgi:signal transduction histidine kinase
MVIAIQNARLYQDLEHEKTQIVETQDEARKKLARDLHDGPTQGVSAITMRIGLVRKVLQTHPEQVDQQLALIEDLARRTSTEIRHMLFTLRPLVLETDGLEAALRTMAQKMQETFQQNVGVEVNQAIVKQLEIGRQTVVFYLVEEALNNARKHAQAPQIWVRLNYFANDPGFALLEIADNGIGFDVGAINKEYEKRGSLGMVNLRERTELLNGVLNIDSAPGKGTRVQIYIPLTDEAADRLENGQFKIKFFYFRGNSAETQRLQIFFQLACPARMAQAAQSFTFYLADAFTRQSELLSHLFQRVRVPVLQTEA